MDPITGLVWAVVAVLVLAGVIVALRYFKELVLIVLALTALAVLVGLITEPAATMQKINGVVAQITQLIQQIKTSVGK